MNYIVVVQAPAYALGNGRFAIESAFAEHLRALRASTGGEFNRLVLVAPSLTPAAFAARRSHLAILDAEQDGIAFEPAFPEDASPARFWRYHAAPIRRRLTEMMRGGAVLHSGLSTDLWRPLMALANLTALLARVPTIFFVDIDFRQHSRQLHALGWWGRRAYVTNRLLHDPLKSLQVRLAVRFCDLVLLKSATMVRDFGRGRPWVKNFFDTAHDAAHVLDGAAMHARQEALLRGEPLRLAYFGRLARNKGVDRMIEAVALARADGARLTLQVIGDGDERDALVAQAQRAGLEGVLHFPAPLPYGAPLFQALQEVDVALAAPLIEDTPRAAFDAFARGLPIVAFDLTYFRDLAEATGAVALARWPDARSLADRLVELSRDRPKLAAMAARARAFAAENTQSIWLARRDAWMRRYALPRAMELRRAAPGPALSAVPDSGPPRTAR
jgi:glycosyltransferase involved in cell wall biosynthesis